MSEREVAEANALRKALRIHVYGSGVPPPVEGMRQLAERYRLAAWLVENAASAGYDELTRVQMQAVPLLLAGREVLACAPTGSGKTAAFVMPLLARLARPMRQGVRAVAISPTQELARQTHREIVKLGRGSRIGACVLTKKLAAAAIAAQGQGDVFRRYDVLVCTPLRLVSLLKRGAIALDGVRVLVLDEADKLLALGFLEQVDEILAACSSPDVQRCLFSATMMPSIEELSDTVLRQPVRVVVGEKNAAAEIIEQKLVFCGREDGKILALRQMVREGIKPPVLIFVQSKERAMQLFHELVFDGINVDVIHAERTPAQRDATVDKFRSGKVWVLIATELMARGMDFKGVSLVINFDFPQSTVSYIHRIGRTGRAGRPGRAVTFFTEADVEQLRAIANVMKASGCDVPPWMLKMKPLSKNKRRQRATKPISRKPIVKKRVREEASDAKGAPRKTQKRKPRQPD